MSTFPPTCAPGIQRQRPAQAVESRQNFLVALGPLRCHAYLVRSERYLEVEPSLLEGLTSAPRTNLIELFGNAFVKLELLSGEWRLLFEQSQAYQPFVDHQRRLARMAVAPDKLSTLVNTLWRHETHDIWTPIAHGLTNLTYALPLASALIGVFFVEEEDEWLFYEPCYEMMAIRPDVYSLIEPFMRDLIHRGDYTTLARLAADHANSAVEFTSSGWLEFREDCRRTSPELIELIDQSLISPSQSQQTIRGIKNMLDPQRQPSLDAWLRVHGDKDPQGLVFRDIRNERAAARATRPMIRAVP